MFVRFNHNKCKIIATDIPQLNTTIHTLDLKIKSLNDNYNYYRIFFCSANWIVELNVMQLALLA
jgi:hypothetical protein